MLLSSPFQAQCLSTCYYPRAAALLEGTPRGTKVPSISLQTNVSETEIKMSYNSNCLPLWMEFHTEEESD